MSALPAGQPEPDPAPPAPPLAPRDAPAGPARETPLGAPARPAAEPPRPARRWLRLLLMLAVLGLAVKLVLPQLGSIQDSLELVRTMAPAYLALAALAQVASYVASGVMLKVIVRLSGDRLGTGRATMISAASSAVGLVAGGAIGTAGSVYRWLRDAGVGLEGALLASWLPTVLNGAVMVVFAIIGAAELMLQHGVTWAEGTALGLAFGFVAALCVLLLWAARRQEAAERLVMRLERRWARLRHRAPREQLRGQVAAAWGAIALLRHGWKQPTLYALLTVGCDALTLWLVFVAVLEVVSPGSFFAGYGVPMLIGKVGVVPGGIGIVEGMMVAIFHHLGEPTRLAVLAVIGYRLLAFWLPNLAGFALVPVLQARRGGREPASGE